jgi:hypothetical protein
MTLRLTLIGRGDSSLADLIGRVRGQRSKPMSSSRHFANAALSQPSKVPRSNLGGRNWRTISRSSSAHSSHARIIPTATFRPNRIGCHDDLGRRRSCGGNASPRRSWMFIMRASSDALNLELARTQLYESYLFPQRPLSKFLLCGGGLGECNAPWNHRWNRSRSLVLESASRDSDLHNAGTYSGRVRY